MPRRVLLLHSAADQSQSYGDAAMRLGVQPVPYHISGYDEPSSARASQFAASQAVDACLACDDRAAVVASSVSRTLGLPGHPSAATEVARNKLLTRERLRDTDLLVPWFFPTMLEANPSALASMVDFPCVVKPLVPSASRGVVRADDAKSFMAAMERVRRLMTSAEMSGEAAEDRVSALVEGFIEGWEFALEGVMHHGVLTGLALFDKPDPLDGPLFEDRMYVTPSLAPESMQWDMLDAVSRAAASIGLHHGPVRADCRVGDRGVYVISMGARPLGRGWAKALRFQKEGKGAAVSYEEVLLRHALGESPNDWRREAGASGAMRVDADGAFVYARGASTEEVERTLRAAVIESGHG